MNGVLRVNFIFSCIVLTLFDVIFLKIIIYEAFCVVFDSIFLPFCVKWGEFHRKNSKFSCVRMSETALGTKLL